MAAKLERTVVFEMTLIAWQRNPAEPEPLPRLLAESQTRGVAGLPSRGGSPSFAPSSPPRDPLLWPEIDFRFGSGGPPHGPWHQGGPGADDAAHRAAPLPRCCRAEHGRDLGRQ